MDFLDSLGSVSANSRQYGSLQCSPCSKKGHFSDAVQFCQQCKKYFCFACLRQHNAVLDDHTLVSKKFFSPSQTQAMSKCTKHDGETIGMWCNNHEMAVCASCVLIDHRDCKDLLHIRDMKVQEGELKETEEQTLKTGNGLLRLKTLKQADLKNSQTERRRALDVIESFELKLDAIKRELGTKARAAVEARYKDVQETVRNDVIAIEDVMCNINATSKRMQQDAGDDAEKFMQMKQGKQDIVAAQMVSMEISRAPSSQGIIYLIDPNLMETITEIESFGKVYQHLFSVKGKKEICIKVATESKCNVNDCCLLPDSSILIVDCTNKKLKRLTGQQVTDYCTFPVSPNAVCRTGLQEAAVSLSDNSVQLVVMAPRLTPTRLIKMTHPCWGLTYREGELFVSDNADHVFVYKTNGTPVRTISKGTDGKSLFKNASHLAAHTHRNEIYVADHGQGIVCINSNGQVLYSFSSNLLKGIRGICSDNGDGLFVSGIQSNNILQLGKGGKLLGVIADEGKGVKHPRSLLYNPQKNQLFVTRDVQDSILELELA